MSTVRRHNVAEESTPLLGPTTESSSPPAATGANLVRLNRRIRVYPSKIAVPYERNPNARDFKGGQGVVYQANLRTESSYKAISRKTFAVKQMQIADPRARKRLRGEIHHLWRCDHDNVIRLREAYVISRREWIDTIFLVFETWAPVSLERLICDLLEKSLDGESFWCPWYQRNRHSVVPWPSIVRQCILGLQHIHEKGIIHKDIKPDNILLLDESKNEHEIRIRPIIADLGISKLENRSGITTGIGTGRYMAPLQQPFGGGGAPATVESDIFSLGCSLSWIPALLTTDTWDRARKETTGVFLLNEITEDKFENIADGIVPFLKNLRTYGNPFSPSRDSPVNGFYEVMEDIIGSMLNNDIPPKRMPLEDALGRLSALDTEHFSTSRPIYSASDDNVASPYNQAIRGSSEANSHSGAAQRDPKYLDVCVFQQGRGFDRHRIIELAGIHTDDQLLLEIYKACFPTHRRKMAGLYKLWQMLNTGFNDTPLAAGYICVQICWIKFKWDRENNFIRLEKDSLPTNDEGRSGGYEFSELYREELSYFPKLLMGYLNTKETKHFRNDDFFWLDCIPKRSISEPTLGARCPEIPGWGIQVVWKEYWSPFRVWGFLGRLCLLIGGVLYLPGLWIAISMIVIIGVNKLHNK